MLPTYYPWLLATYWDDPPSRVSMVSHWTCTLVATRWASWDLGNLIATKPPRSPQKGSLVTLVRESPQNAGNIQIKDLFHKLPRWDSCCEKDPGYLHLVLCHWSICGYWCLFESPGTTCDPISWWTFGSYWLWSIEQVAGEECFSVLPFTLPTRRAGGTEKETPPKGLGQPLVPCFFRVVGIVLFFFSAGFCSIHSI